MAVIEPSHLPEDEEFEKKLRKIRAGENPSQTEIMKLAEKSTASDENIIALALLIQEDEESDEEDMPPIQ